MRTIRRSLWGTDAYNQWKGILRGECVRIVDKRGKSMFGVLTGECSLSDNPDLCSTCIFDRPLCVEYTGKLCKHTIPLEDVL